MSKSLFPHDYPKGYKQYRVLLEMSNHHGMTYTEIIKFAYELSHGIGSFNKVDNRGYWSGAFVSRTTEFSWCGSKVNGWVTNLCNKKNKVYTVNGPGCRKFEELADKFGGMNKHDARKMHANKHGFKLVDTSMDKVEVEEKIEEEVTYTEKEVRKLFLGVQCEIAQYIIGNRIKPVVPCDWFEKNKK